jgi:uncharacterized protein (DUF2336 family)
MSNVVSQLAELDELIVRMPPAKRTLALEKVGAFFVRIAKSCRPEHVEAFDDVLSSLTVGADTPALSALSRALAPLANGPVKLIERLALEEEIAIAEPPLMQSPCIDDKTLCNIARYKSQSHQLAIACRPRLSAQVTEALVRHGDVVIMRYVASNKGAEISDTARRAMAAAGEKDKALAAMIGKRDFTANSYSKAEQFRRA